MNLRVKEIVMARARIGIKYNFIIHEPNNYEKDERWADISISADTEKECNALMNHFQQSLNLNMKNMKCYYNTSKINDKSNKWKGNIKVTLKSRNEFVNLKSMYYLWKQQIYSNDITPRVLDGESLKVIDEKEFYKIELKNDQIFKNASDGRDYEVIYKDGLFVVLKCRQDNIIGTKEIVLTSSIKQNLKTKEIIWNRANYFNNENEAMRALNKKYGLDIE